jgi:hypothetical protein
VGVDFLAKDFEGKEIDGGLMITQRMLSIQTLLKTINIIIDLVMWRQNYLISIIVFIVRRQTTFQTNAQGRRRFINEQITIVGLALGDGI